MLFFTFTELLYQKLSLLSQSHIWRELNSCWFAAASHPSSCPPLKLSCINILSARDSTPSGPGHLNREYQHSIGHPSCAARFSSRASLHLHETTQWRGVSKKGPWAVRAKRQIRHADMQVNALSSHKRVWTPRWPLRRPGPSFSSTLHESLNIFVILGLQMSPGRSRRCKTKAWSSLLSAECRIPTR